MASPAIHLSVVIPCFNEEATLRELVHRLEVELVRLMIAYEVVVVNDGSTDDSTPVLQELATTRPWLKGVILRRQSGQTAALMAGLEHAQGDVVVTMDGDLQNDPADIARLLSQLDRGFDVVSGWRVDRRDHRLGRVWPSRVANALISLVTGVPLHDHGCTLKAYRRDALTDVRLYGEMHRFIPVYASWNGARIAELPVTHCERRAGASNYGLNRTIKVVLDLFVLLFLQRFAQKPIYVFGTCGLTSLAVSAGAGGAMIYYKFWGGKTFIETPLPLLWATMFFTGVLCLLLGLIAEMNTRIYHEAQGKRTYRVRSTINLSPASEGRAERAV